MIYADTYYMHKKHLWNSSLSDVLLSHFFSMLLLLWLVMLCYTFVSLTVCMELFEFERKCVCVVTPNEFIDFDLKFISQNIRFFDWARGELKFSPVYSFFFFFNIKICKIHVVAAAATLRLLLLIIRSVHLSMIMR